MKDREIYLGSSPAWEGRFIDEDEQPIDFTQGTRYAILTATITVDGITSTITKDTRISSDWTWSNQAQGEGTWFFTKAETTNLETGKWRARVWFYDDAATPEVALLVGEAFHYVRS